ncbi:hypothetical protein EON83_17210 [bacterium]|nr:MAG: hypothetical protein EON83_17210 [bacterium]
MNNSPFTLSPITLARLIQADRKFHFDLCKIEESGADLDGWRSEAIEDVVLACMYVPEDSSAEIELGADGYFCRDYLTDLYMKLGDTLDDAKGYITKVMKEMRFLNQNNPYWKANMRRLDFDWALIFMLREERRVLKIRTALEACDIYPRKALELDLLPLVLDELGVPSQSESFIRDGYFNQYHATVKEGTDEEYRVFFAWVRTQPQPA